jgi:long-chain acyl-CoA synthetase
LSSHPLVRDVAVFGVPDADLGETVFALVELDVSETGDLALAQELADHCAGVLARFKLPRRIAFGSVGRTETGKIGKAALRDQFREGIQGFAVNRVGRSDGPFVSVSQKEAHHV